MNIILYVTLISHMILRSHFVNAVTVGASVPAYSWLARLRTLQRAKEMEFQMPDTKKDLFQSKLSKRDKTNNEAGSHSLNKLIEENHQRKEGDVMSCIDEFAREFERKWHMDPKRGIKKGRDTMSEEEIWNRLPRSDGSAPGNSASESDASDDKASLENITKMLSFGEDEVNDGDKATREDDKQWKYSRLRTREENKMPLKSKDTTDDNEESADLVRKNQQFITEEVRDEKNAKNDDEYEKDVQILDNASVKNYPRLTAGEESKSKTSHDEIKRVMYELENQDNKRVTTKNAHASAELVATAMAKSKKYVSPGSEGHNDGFLESNMRDPPRYIIKVDGNGYITSENERYLQKLTEDRANSELLLNLNDLRQEQQSPKEKSLEENIRAKREFKQFDDYNSEGRQNKDYLKQLEDSFPRDQGDYRDQVLKELKEHVRVKRVMLI